MSFIFSTESDFARRGRVRSTRQDTKYFARVCSSEAGRDIISLSRAVCRKIKLDRWAAVGYDEENNIVIVKPLAEQQNGAILVCLAGGSGFLMRQKLDLTGFFAFLGVNSLTPRELPR